MTTRTPQRPGTKRPLQAVPDLPPSFGDKIDEKIREHGGDPRKVRRAGRVAGLVVAVGLAGGALGVAMAPSAPKDVRTELHQDQERGFMEAFVNSGKTEVQVNGTTVSRIAGTVRITPDNAQSINMRSTLARQNYDRDNPADHWDSNADTQVGYNTDTERDNFVELVDPVVVTFENGDTYMGGLMADEDGNVPEANTPEAFAEHASWAFVSELQKPYSGAKVEIVPGTGEVLPVNVGEGATGNLPVAYIAHTEQRDGTAQTVYGG